MSRNILMYGGPVIEPEPWPTSVPATEPFQPFTPIVGPTQLIPQTEPPTKDSVVRDLVGRIDWLRARLANVDAMREELATLERMLAATKLDPSASGGP